jgi:two-component system response regulator AtoC
LAEHFLKRYGSGIDVDCVHIEPDAMRTLMSHRWPGNIRELENAMERACIMCEGGLVTSACLPGAVIQGGDLSQYEICDDEDLSIKKAENTMERELIRKALAKTAGNRTQAAKILEISHRSLLYKLKEYGIE